MAGGLSEPSFLHGPTARHRKRLHNVDFRRYPFDRQQIGAFASSCVCSHFIRRESVSASLGNAQKNDSHEAR